MRQRIGWLLISLALLLLAVNVETLGGPWATLAAMMIGAMGGAIVADKVIR